MKIIRKTGMRMCAFGITCMFLLGLNNGATAFAIESVQSVPAFSEASTDEEFLEFLQYHLFQFFLHESNKETGLVKDRAGNFGTDAYTVASVASVGFALPAYVVGAERGWIEESEAYDRVLKTLLFFRDSMPQKNGFFYHFADMHTGARYGDSEISSIDTALFIGGVLFVKQYYQGTEVATIAQELYDRVDWEWMLNGGNTVSMGWLPKENGGTFLDTRWEHYDEALLLYILGIGSSTHALAASVWDAIERPIGRYGEHVLISSSPLFTHQYPHVFVDFRNKHDKYADYFENSIAATKANREFCIDQQARYKTYGEDVWGITACDGPDGYRAYGARPGHASHDGTIAPTGAGASIVFTPDLSVRALRHMYVTHKERLWGKYGFADSFNWDKDWVATDVIGIDQGAMLLMIENYRTGLIWKYGMQNAEVQKALELIGFEKGSKQVVMPEPITLTAEKREKNIFIDGVLEEWYQVRPFKVDVPASLEYGEVKDARDFSAKAYFLWDEDYLFVAVKVRDNDVYCPHEGEAIYKNDTFELFFDPADDGFEWGNVKDVQLGMSPQCRESGYQPGKGWAWFQKVDPVSTRDLVLASEKTAQGYILEAAIKWSFIGITPEKGKRVRISPAFHDVDAADSTEAKCNIFFQDITGKDDRKCLAVMTLDD